MSDERTCAVAGCESTAVARLFRVADSGERCASCLRFDLSTEVQR